MLMQIRITPEQAVYYGAVAGIALGVILGLAVLILGIRKKKQRLGVIGLVCSILVGPISGLLSVIVAAVFIYLILKKPSASNTAETANQNSSDVKIDNS